MGKMGMRQTWKSRGFVGSTTSATRCATRIPSLRCAIPGELRCTWGGEWGEVRGEGGGEWAWRVGMEGGYGGEAGGGGEGGHPRGC